MPGPTSPAPGPAAGVPGERALELAWERALELAWESFCGGTTPVGAVVTDAAGAIVAEGRGRRFESVAPPGQLAWTAVATPSSTRSPGSALTGTTPTTRC